MEEAGYGEYLPLFTGKSAGNTETASCRRLFLGVEEYFSRVKGVIKSESAIPAEQRKNPSYEEVCTGKRNMPKLSGSLLI